MPQQIYLSKTNWARVYYCFFTAFVAATINSGKTGTNRSNASSLALSIFHTLQNPWISQYLTIYSHLFTACSSSLVKMIPSPTEKSILLKIDPQISAINQSTFARLQFTLSELAYHLILDRKELQLEHSTICWFQSMLTNDLL